MTVDRRVWWLAGGALVWSALCVLFGAVPKEQSGVAGRWRPVADPAPLEKGARYRAAAHVSWVVPTVLVANAIPDHAEKAGFTAVKVMRDRPADWPGGDADLYIEATWSRSNQTMKWPDGMTGAWVLSDA